MSSRTATMKYTQDSLAELIEGSDALLIGIGSGMSTSGGLDHAGAPFKEHFSDFEARYGIHDMYSGSFHPFTTSEERWAFMSRLVMYNRYTPEATAPYKALRKLVEGKDYFIITTNVDHQGQKAGFDKRRLFYTQGDYGLFQCSKPCHKKTYDNEEQIRLMVERQEDMRIPSSLIPHCPVCGREMTLNLRCDDTFVEDEGWKAAALRYQHFLDQHVNSKLLLSELGVGWNTPGIIKYPFWQITERYPDTRFVTINKGEALIPREIEGRSICIDGDIGAVLDSIST